MRLKLTFAGIILALAATLALKAQANQAIATNIDDLMKADVAFTGVCTKAEAGTVERPKGSILVTRYTFAVSDALKGDVAGTFSFTQWGATREDAARLGKPFVYGPPLYDVGKEYTLFLTSESRLGLRSPVGLAQGKFEVIRGPEGKAMVVNEFNNKSLFRNLPQTKAMTKALSAGGIEAGVAAPSGPMDYESFKAVIEGLKGRE